MFFRDKPPFLYRLASSLLPNSSSRQLLVTSGFPNTSNITLTLLNNGFAFGKERHRYVLPDAILIN
jgi:hypothetical protein